MEIDRRDFILAGIGMAAAGNAAAQTAPVWPSAENLPLWPGSPPNAPANMPVPARTFEQNPGSARPLLRLTGIAQPSLAVFRPDKPNGRALLVLPGGAYRLLSVQSEGMEIAARLNGSGYTVFVLTYRLPAEGWSNRADVPLQDAQRAMRVIRTKAADYSVDPKQVGVLGFSAGGHLAASLITDFGQSVYAALDQADRLSARPDFAALAYPVIAMGGSLVHENSRNHLLGERPDAMLVERRSPERRISAETPPCFLIHACDDKTVKVENGMMFVQALREKSVPVEAHFFESGGHGFGVMQDQTMPAALWLDLFARWLARR
jgi:acetyl esterase/lipase